jgi:hypothetical protein
MTGITGILETSLKAVQYASTWTLSELVDNIPNETCARIIRAALSGVLPVPEPLFCPQPVTPDCRATFSLHECTALKPPQDNEPASSGDGGNGEARNPAEGLQWGILLPVTSRCAKSPHALWGLMEETFGMLVRTIDGKHRASTVVYIAIDHNDPELDTPEAFERVQVLLLSSRPD